MKDSILRLLRRSSVPQIIDAADLAAACLELERDGLICRRSIPDSEKLGWVLSSKGSPFCAHTACNEKAEHGFDFCPWHS